MGQKLGQHFLKNRAKLRQIASFLEIQKGEKVVEIGPGHGELTSEILAFQPGKLISIEKDRYLCENLTEEYAKNNNFQSICGDALSILPEIASSMGEYKITGNLPYYISGRLFRVLSELKNQPKVGVFLVQKEVGERICAGPGKMNLLSVSVGSWAKAEIMAKVSKDDFSPPPKVESVIIKIAAIPGAPAMEKDRYFAAMKALFKQPRKTILNNLKAVLSDKSSGIALELQKIGLNPELRPETLSVEELAAIARIFF